MTLNHRSEIASAIADRKAEASYKEARMNLITEIAAVVIACMIIFSFVFGVYVQKGNDMYPAIKDGDIVLYYRTHKIVNTEAVVYELDGETGTSRVEASAGTVVSATGDLQLTFDGNYLPISKDDGIFSKTYGHEGAKYPVTVQDDCCYILGDNRDTAKDSREFGPIKKKFIKGRIVTVVRRRQI